MNLNSDSLSCALNGGGALADAYDAVWSALWRQTHVPATVLELCRLRLAKLHSAQADFVMRKLPIDEHKANAVLAGRYAESDLFDAAEKSALMLAEVYAQDPAAISDHMAAQVKQYVGESGLVCLIEALGFIDGRLRLAQMFDALQRAEG